MDGIGDEEATAEHQRAFFKQDGKTGLLENGGMKGAEEVREIDEEESCGWTEAGQLHIWEP